MEGTGADLEGSKAERGLTDTEETAESGTEMEGSESEETDSEGIAVMRSLRVESVVVTVPKWE